MLDFRCDSIDDQEHWNKSQQQKVSNTELSPLPVRRATSPVDDTTTKTKLHNGWVDDGNGAKTETYT